VAVWRGLRERDAGELALVLRAMDIEHEVARLDGSFVLLVAARDAPRAIEQLRRFRAENPQISEQEEAGPDGLASGVDAALGWSLLLVALHLLASRSAWGLPWEDAGIADAGAMRAGQWWRAVTALTLHADASHLAGNVLFGAAFLAALCPFLGTGAASLVCLLSGALGNVFNALLQDAGHRSLGASTAVFGALGALAALQWRHRVRLRQRRLRRWTPLVMAAILLGYLGTEGVRTDLVAHVTGLVAGLALGSLPWSAARGALSRAWVQWTAMLVTLALLAGAWSCALCAR
jgi:rhomboid protease GluP